MNKLSPYRGETRRDDIALYLSNAILLFLVWKTFVLDRTRYVYDVCKYPCKFYYIIISGSPWIEFDFQLKSRGPMLCVCNTCQGPVVVKKFLRYLAQSVKTRQGGEYQKRFWQSVSAQVVACLAVVTLIKDCQQNLEITQ